MALCYIGGTLIPLRLAAMQCYMRFLVRHVEFDDKLFPCGEHVATSMYHCLELIACFLVSRPSNDELLKQLARDELVDSSATSRTTAKRRNGGGWLIVSRRSAHGDATREPGTPVDSRRGGRISQQPH